VEKRDFQESMVNKFSILRKGIARLFNPQKNTLIVSSSIKSKEPNAQPIFPDPYLKPVSQDLKPESDFQTHEAHGNLNVIGHFLPCDNSLNLLNAYLFSHENFQEDFLKLKKILEMDQIIFEIGCGSGEVAYEIALKNSHIGVIATDKYDWTAPAKEGSHYQKVALAWRDKQLKIQSFLPDNLVVLRAETDILRFFPDHRIDTVLMLNPEPTVCEAFLKFISENTWYQKIKPGPNQILVVPFSREMGVNACSGFECVYTEHRLGELGILKTGHFHFRRGEKNHWGIDMTRASAYSRNSTQNDVYVYGNQFQAKPLSSWNKMIRKIF
jgi:hypothetical protein